MSSQTTVGDWAAQPTTTDDAQMATVGDGAAYRGFDTDPSVDTEADAPQECAGCGGHVTDRYRRVMGDNANRVEACPNCSPNNANVRGAPSGTDHQSLIGRGGR